MLVHWSVVRRAALAIATVWCAHAVTDAQTMAGLHGRVLDASGAPLPGAVVRVRDESIGFDVSVQANAEGRYYVGAIPSGTYTVTADAPGFRTERIEALNVDVGRSLVRDFLLAVGERTETVVVRGETPLIDRVSATVGHVVTADTVQQIPLNGRHFTDLGLLVPGSVSPSQTGFSSRPIRGVGSLAFNTAGNREEAVSFLVNGVSTNNLTFGSLYFEPPLGSIHEFKVDNSAFAAEHGHVSGAIVNIVSKSGTDRFRGEAFEFFRNDALDARNFFEFTSPDPHPFNRNQFGGSLGGPIWRGRTFFFGAYEGFRQRQGLDMNSLVLSDEQRAAATNPIVRQLIPLIPRANFVDAAGTPRFVGSAPAVADTDRWSIDVRHNAGKSDRIHAFYGTLRRKSLEPAAQGNSIPGFGTVSQPFASVLTVGATHLFGAALVNEAVFGRSYVKGSTFPAAPLNPSDFGVANGVTRPIGLPQMIVAGDLNFGGPGTFPQGRTDTSVRVPRHVQRRTRPPRVEVRRRVSSLHQRELRRRHGSLQLPERGRISGRQANAFSITLGERRSVIDQKAMGLFVQDDVRLGGRVTIQIGMRYEWHVTPTERDDRFIVFDARSASLLRVGRDVPEIYEQNNRNFEPRLGVAWDLKSDGRTVLRAAYARAVDQPGTTAVRDTAGNPPFAAPLTAAGSIPLATAIGATRPAGLAPATVDPQFRNASVQSWNVNLQRQLAAYLAVTVAYFGSHGTNLRISRNLNQPVNGVPPFPTLSTSSPIAPGTPLGVITQVESSGFSNYHAGWVSVSKRLSRGLQLETSYTLSKSLDTNSLNSSGFAVQNSYDIPGQYGLSDFDARHRFVLSATYALPFTGSVLTRGWQVATVVQAQSGNPVNIVTSNSRLTGVANSVRPDVTGPIGIIGSVDQWFDTIRVHGGRSLRQPRAQRRHRAGLQQYRRFSDQEREVGGRLDLQFSVDAFDVFNHANFGPPGNIVGSPTFGKITRTRLPTGEAGSSRQIQLAVRVSF